LVRLIALIGGGALLVAAAGADEPPPKSKPKPSFRDSLDGAFDMSDRIIESGAFVPVPIVITEPALGSFGGGMAPVFIKKHPPRDKDGRTTPIKPDVTAVAGAYTANDSWFGGAGRVASLPRHGIRYTVGGGFVNLNLDFYETLPSGESRAFGIKTKGAAFVSRVMKEVAGPRFSLGLQYTLGKVEVAAQEPGNLPSFVTQTSLDSVISTAGPVVEFDGRDNIFTPDRGLKLHGHFTWSDDWLGSDYRFGRGNAYLYGYVPLGAHWSRGRNWISAFRLDWQQVVDDPPFYLLPYIDMRGIPAVRYQGRTTLLLETEQRVDVTRRWSAVVFGGVAKAFDELSAADEAELVYAYGGGFRYLIARKLKLRMGVDVARGPEEWAYYIVFGSAWRR